MMESLELVVEDDDFGRGIGRRHEGAATTVSGLRQYQVVWYERSTFNLDILFTGGSGRIWIR